MSKNNPVPIFDGHNDVLTRLMRAGGESRAGQFQERGSSLDLDVVRAGEGRFSGGLFSIWVPASGPAQGALDAVATADGAGIDVPLPEPLERGYALDVVLQQITILQRLQRLGAVRICIDTDSIRSCLRDGVLAAVMHLEGAEALDEDLYTLDVLYRAGLRSLGPVWSRNTLFGQGVPFRFPSTPDIGSGLTEAGRRLVLHCNRLGILIDCSHLNERGFHDVASLSDAPLVATHSNAHALCPHSRNLTDQQLDIIAASGGLVGLNLATEMLRADGRMLPDVPLRTLLAHLDHLLARLGERGVAIGTDLEGAMMPALIGDASGLQVMIEAMRAHGYSEERVHRIARHNWLDVLERTWKS